jgi:hypothetical protein
MKYVLASLLTCFFLNLTKAQDIKLKDLAVPNSPSFILLDAAPSNIEAPANPREFTLGLLKNLDLNNKFLGDFSMEFAPYWWLKPSQRDAYSFMGLTKKRVNGAQKAGIDRYEQNIFSGLKFSSFSLAFLTKDMIADSVNLQQKIVSLGARTTLIKVRPAAFANQLNAKLIAWHDEAQLQLKSLNEALESNIDNAEARDSLLKAIANFLASEKAVDYQKRSNEIKDMVDQKPIFNWDLSTAFTQYGVGDTAWKTGRVGVWTTFASYIPISKLHPENYFDLLVRARYFKDNYAAGLAGSTVVSGTIDIGAKLGIELSNFNLAAEGVYRKVEGQSDWQKRVTGIVNYKINDNLFFSGTYGTDFGPQNKLIALFGLNWGFGEDKIGVEESK